MSEAFISGRSKETVQALLQAAKALGVDPQRIRTSSHPAGYFVPNKVAQAYQGTEGTEPEAEDAAVEPEGQQETAPEVPAPAEPVEAVEAEDDGVDPQPPGNASQAAWADWARRNKGYDESEGLTRDQLKQRFGA